MTHVDDDASTVVRVREECKFSVELYIDELAAEIPGPEMSKRIGIADVDSSEDPPIAHVILAGTLQGNVRDPWTPGWFGGGHDRRIGGITDVHDNDPCLPCGQVRDIP